MLKLLKTEDRQLKEYILGHVPSWASSDLKSLQVPTSRCKAYAAVVSLTFACLRISVRLYRILNTNDFLNDNGRERNSALMRKNLFYVLILHVRY